MNIDRLTALAEAYGANLRRWPEHEFASADWNLFAHPAARAVLARAAALDSLLDACPVLPPSRNLSARVNQTLTSTATCGRRALGG